MTRRVWRGWPAAAALGLAVAVPSWTENGLPASAGLVPPLSEEPGPYHLIDARLDYTPAGHVAQARGSPSAPAGASGAKPDAPEASASELNKQLANPVTSLWSLQFQFNNFRLENGEWNNNLLFQPVLPISLTKDLNLITRPVIPLYNVLPHETAPGEFDHTVGFGDITLLELLSSIPQTATVQWSAAKMTPPVFDGAPKPAPIPGTPLQYVVNSATPIII